MEAISSVEDGTKQGGSLSLSTSVRSQALGKIASRGEIDASQVDESVIAELPPEIADEVRRQMQLARAVAPPSPGRGHDRGAKRPQPAAARGGRGARGNAKRGRGIESFFAAKRDR